MTPWSFGREQVARVAKRRTLPAALKRELLEEAGYRCAVPTCRESTALEFAHIVPHAMTEDDSFDNLIVLCSTDHSRYDQTRQIPRSSIVAYKRNLGVLNGRYGSLERRVLQWFADHGTQPGQDISVPAPTDLTLMYLLRDGLVERHPDRRSYADISATQPLYHIEHFQLTKAGRAFVVRYLDAQPLADY